MNCSHCTEVTTKKRAKKTKLGDTTFFCPQCQQTFNERSGTPFNSLEFPTDIVLLAIVWRLRYTLSLCDVSEMFLERGFTFCAIDTRSVANQAAGTSGNLLVCE